jgi:phage terminase small subunit
MAGPKKKRKAAEHVGTSRKGADGLTDRQRTFVSEYLIDMNAAAAYRRAGYSEKGSDAGGARLLVNVSIAAAIERALAARSERTQITADRTLRELADVAFSEFGQILDFTGTDLRLKPVNEITEAARRAIAAMKVKRQGEGQGEAARTVEVTEFKLWDKLSALEKLCKHLGLFIDKHGGEIHDRHTFDLGKLTDEQLDQLERLLESAAVRSGEPAAPEPGAARHPGRPGDEVPGQGEAGAEPCGGDPGGKGAIRLA